MPHLNVKDEKGFTLIEVAVASLLMTGGLIFLATLFTLAISQNRFNSHFTSTTALAQQKLEELMAIERNDNRLTVGGGLTESTKQATYWDQIYVDDRGTITTTIPAGQVPNYARYWLIEADPGGLTATVLISVKVVALQAARGRTNEQTTLTTTRSF
jgi:type II secretory pathway pseudopilin PulG